MKRSGKLDHRNVGQEGERERETGRVKWKFSYGQGTRGEGIFIRWQDVFEDGKIGRRKWIIVGFLRNRYYFLVLMEF